MIMDEKKSQVACHGLRVKGSLHCSALTSALLHKDRFGSQNAKIRIHNGGKPKLLEISDER